MLDKAHGGIHARLLHDANQFVAHQVNDSEQVLVQLVLADPEVIQQVDGVAVTHARRLGPPTEDIAPAQAITTELASLALSITDQTRDALLTWAQGQPIEGWYADATAPGAGGTD